MILRAGGRDAILKRAEEWRSSQEYQITVKGKIDDICQLLRENIECAERIISEKTILTLEQARDWSDTLRQIRDLMTEVHQYEVVCGRDEKRIRLIDTLVNRYKDLEGRVKEIRNDLHRP